MTEVFNPYKTLFEKLIPSIQKHVDESGHVHNLSTACHDCVDFRYQYAMVKAWLWEHPSTTKIPDLKRRVEIELDHQLMSDVEPRLRGD